MKFNLIHILLVFVIFSCEPEKKNPLESKLTFSSEIASVIKEAEHFNSEVLDSTFIVRYETGEPRLTFKRSNGKLDSTLLEQYKSGLPKIRVTFEDGRLVFGEHGSYFDSLLAYFFRSEVDTFRRETPIYKTYYHTNPEGELVYERIYNSAGEPLHSSGDLILHTKGNNNGDSTILHFYLVNEPYQSRYYDLQRRFYLSSSDGRFNNSVIPINEEYSAAFITIYNIDSTELILTGIAEYSDLIFNRETHSVLRDSVTVRIE